MVDEIWSHKIQTQEVIVYNVQPILAGAKIKVRGVRYKTLNGNTLFATILSTIDYCDKEAVIRITFMDSFEYTGNLELILCYENKFLG